MAFTHRDRDYRDYENEIGDRVEFRAPCGDLLRGRVTGGGAAGNYLEVLGSDGNRYSGYSSDSDLRKLFND